MSHHTVHDARHGTSRRAFLRHAAQITGGFAAAHLLPACGKRPAGAPMPPPDAPRPGPARRITLGLIGLGEEGAGKNLEAFLREQDAQILAVCDVDRYKARGARLRADAAYGEQTKSGRYQACAETGDWREIIARDDIDAVVISTPDHWHVPIAAAAARAGKDIFCEKPLSLTIADGRHLCKVVHRYGRILQTATENRATPAFYHAVRLARSGQLGKLHTIHVHLYRGFGSSEAYEPPKPIVPEAVPDGFDYDMWLGPAPHAPYMKARCAPTFRYIRDYSGGNLTDWGAHLLDVAQWGNNTEYTGPITVEGSGTFPEEGLYDVASDWDIRFEYANGVVLHLKSGGLFIRFEGEEGWVQADFSGFEASRPELRQQIFTHKVAGVVPHSEGEHRNFLDSVITRQPPYLPVEIAHRSITLGHLANIALFTGRKLTWDPEGETFPNDPAANRFLARAKRSPWNLEL
jgi:predicted dehydrogenase